jgi:hypothetical protein
MGIEPCAVKHPLPVLAHVMVVPKVGIKIRVEAANGALG